MNLSFDEIKDGEQFEDLVADFFRKFMDDPKNSVTNVQVLQTGVGVDGGRDILIEFDFLDGIKRFKRKWIVQCKFHRENISPSKMNTVNIPSLIHACGAVGYLLICRSRPTSGLTDLFEKLNRECRFGYSYEYWNGNQFLRKLYMREDLHSIHFPRYHKNINLFRK